MTTASMASGDPYCSFHGFTPCMCNQCPSLYNPYYRKTCSMINIAHEYCSDCTKHTSVCVCGVTSDPWKDLQKLSVNLPSGVQICENPSQPREEKPIKKWADELREIAIKTAEIREYEGFSAYIYMLERCKLAAKHGECGIVYWKNNLHLWCKEELEIAADWLRKDNFKVEISPMNDDIRIVVNW